MFLPLPDDFGRYEEDWPDFNPDLEDDKREEEDEDDE